MIATVSPHPLPMVASAGLPLQHLQDSNSNVSTNETNASTVQNNKSTPIPSAKVPIHHDFYRHTFLSWARLGIKKKEEKKDLVPRAQSKASTHDNNEIQVQVESSVISIDQEKLIEQTKQSVRYIAILGISISLVTASLVIGVMALIFGLQPAMPTGAILLFSGNALKLIGSDGQWLFCNGSAVSRIIYQGLFAVVGTTYGQGNGIDTFNLPDLQSRFPLGSSALNDTALVSGGSASHTLTIPELPAHDHDQGSLLTATDGAHTHTYTDPGHNHGGSTGSNSFSSGGLGMTSSGFGNDGGSHTHSIPTGLTGITILSSGSHTHTVSGSTGLQGQGQPFDKMPPYQTVHYIIKI